MRIVDVCAFYSPSGGGVKTYVDRKLRAAEAAGHEMIILAPAGEERIERVGERARIHYVPGRRFPLDPRYHMFTDEDGMHCALDRIRPDIVEMSSPWQSASMLARWRASVPRVMVMHADPLSAYAYRWFGPIAPREVIDAGFGWYWRHLRRLDNHYEQIVVANRGLAERLRAGGLRHVVLNPMGVASGVFSPDLRSDELRAQMLRLCNLGEEATLFVAAGRLAPEKRLPMLIEAVTRAGYRRPVGLLLLGEGRAQAEVERAIGGNPHIRLLPPIRDRALFARWLASADALLHGCEAETFGMVAVEARASGLPLIVPDSGGAPDQLLPGAGHAWRAADRASLHRAIARFLTGDRAAQRTAARAAAATVRHMEDHFDTLFGDYARLLGEARNAA
ncbi:MAG: glycosyltransferase [Sphingobium sp.]